MSDPSEGPKPKYRPWAIACLACAAALLVLSIVLAAFGFPHAHALIPAEFLFIFVGIGLWMFGSPSYQRPNPDDVDESDELDQMSAKTGTPAADNTFI